MQDLLLAQTGSFVENGDFHIGDSSEQNKLFLLIPPKGVYKNAPLKGVGLYPDLLLLEGTVFLEKKHEIRKQLTEDGATVEKITLTGETLFIDAKY